MQCMPRRQGVPERQTRTGILRALRPLHPPPVVTGRELNRSEKRYSMVRKIGFKLMLIVGVTTIVTIGVYSYFNIQSQRDSLLAEVGRHATQLSETIKHSTRYDMLLNQREHIHIIINDIGRDPLIGEVRILNKDGVIIYSSQPDNIGHMVDKKAESCYACHAADMPLEKLSIPERTRIFRIHPDSGRVLGVINAIYTEPSCWEAPCHAHNRDQKVLGVLDITMSLHEVDTQIAMSTLKVGMFAVSTIAVASVIIGLFVNRWVSTRVNTLLDATVQVGSGNLNYTIKDMGNDDLGMLARSFNTMTQKLSEARLQLFQSDKMASLGRLAAGVAHEINNPLTGVLTYSSFLLKRAKDNPELYNDLNVIVRETIRSREIVKSLLDFARQSVPKKTLSNLNDVISRAVGVVENQLTLRGAHLERRLTPDLPPVTVDPNQIQQVFINLLVNASDAMQENGGTITLSSSRILLSPQGNMQIRRATCPKGHSLIDNEVRINGMPTIKLNFRHEAKQGVLMRDPVYGMDRNNYSVTVPESAELTISCPTCGSSLMQHGRLCPRCGAETYAIVEPSDGEIEACSRRSCSWQQWRSIDEAGQKQYIEVKVSDTGIGIPPEDLPKIFEPFFTTKGQKGTGLGLAVIWGIINNHDGTISVESHVGEGTTFSIRIPVP